MKKAFIMVRNFGGGQGGPGSERPYMSFPRLGFFFFNFFILVKTWILKAA